MKRKIVVVCVPIMMLFSASVFGSPAKLSPQEETAVFKAAGYTLKGKEWRLCDDPTASYTAGDIREVRDLNGDGRPEAVVTEGSSYCYGNTAIAFSLVSKQADGSWILVAHGTGIPDFLDTRGVGGWPDIEIGGPGFCFPVVRWNGQSYVLHRHQYEGKACRPR